MEAAGRTGLAVRRVISALVVVAAAAVAACEQLAEELELREPVEGTALAAALVLGGHGPEAVRAVGTELLSRLVHARGNRQDSSIGPESSLSDTAKLPSAVRCT